MTIFEFSKKYNKKYDDILLDALRKIEACPTYHLEERKSIDEASDYIRKNFLPTHKYSEFKVCLTDSGSIVFMGWLDIDYIITADFPDREPDIYETIELYKNTKFIPKDKWEEFETFMQCELYESFYDNKKVTIDKIYQKFLDLNNSIL